MSSRITLSQVEETNDRVAIAVFMYTLNKSVEQTKSICNWGSISRKDMINDLSIDIYGSEQCKVNHPNSDARLQASTQF